MVGPKGEREVKVEDFCTAPGRTVLQPGELLVEILIDAPKPHSADAYLRFIPRNEMDIAVVGVGSWLHLDGDKVSAARISLGAVGGDAAVRGQGVRVAGRQEARRRGDRPRGASSRSSCSSPIDDMRGTAEFRRHLVGVLTKRTLHIAAERARKA